MFWSNSPIVFRIMNVVSNAKMHIILVHLICKFFREGSVAIIHDEKEAEALMEYLQQFTLLFDRYSFYDTAIR